MKNTIFTLLSLLLFLFSNFAIAQYTPKDSILVRTTFLRQFNKKIISKYLFSSNSDSVNAALLSISHSEDITFIDSIIKLDYYKYGDYISFALGQLGESKLSTHYLIQKLQLNYFPFNIEAYIAIGKCGDSTTLGLLFELINDNLIISSAGLPLSVTNFYSREIKNIKSSSFIINNLSKNNTIDYLKFHSAEKPKINKWNLSKKNNNRLQIIESQKKFNTFYALFRLGSTQEAIPELTKFVCENDNKTKLYVLGNFRKLKYFPDDIELLKKLIASDLWRIRTETANSACYYPFKSNDEVVLFLSLLNDENPNVSRTAAIALKNIKYTSDRTWLKSEIEKELFLNKKLPVKTTNNTKGELLISYASLFDIGTEKIIDSYSNLVEPKFIYRFLENDTSNWEFNFKYLSANIEASTEVELLDLLPAYLALQNKCLDNKNYVEKLFKILKSNKTSSVSIIADGLELPLIKKYNKVIHELVFNQIINQKNNPQFAETIISLSNLANKVDKTFYKNVILMLSTSTLSSIRKFAMEKQGHEFNAPIDDSLFKRFWGSAFKYKFAEVETNKGNFTIELMPKFAPITCGNFISLTEKGFYNGVTFHRVVPDFVIQTGDTTNTGWGGPGYEIVSEFSPLPFKRGAVGIASIGKDTEGSQWFVMHSIFPHLNGRYTNWANVIKGMDVVDIIDEGDRVIKINLAK